MFTRWQPFSDLNTELSRAQQELNRVFSRTQRGASFGAFPAINIWQAEGHLVLEAELPGMELSDLEIYVDGENQLTIKGNRRVVDQAKGTWHRRERSFGEFRRTIELPNLVDPAKVEAVLKNGILTISLPKKEELKPRKIDVKLN